MVRRIILGLVFVGVIALAYVGYNNWKQRRAMLSGDVTGGSSDPDLPAVPVAPAAAVQRASPKSEQTVASSDGVTSAMSRAVTSAADTIAPQPPNGTVFAGTGHFQVYRQGNLTWRINTDTGQSCILFATDEEWRKPRVYQNGCGNRGR